MLIISNLQWYVFLEIQYSMIETSTLKLEVYQRSDECSFTAMHSQQQYLQAFQQLNNSLTKIGVKIIKNVAPKYLNKIVNRQNAFMKYRDINNNRIVQFPRKGAFQVLYLNILIYSKLETSAFPNLQFLCDIIKELKCFYEAQPSILDKLYMFRDLQYERRRKQQQGISLYTSLMLQSCGNQSASFAFDLLFRQLYQNQQKKSHRNNYYSYSLLNNNEKKQKIKNIYCLGSFNKAIKAPQQSQSRSQILNSKQKLRPWSSFNKVNICTQRQKKPERGISNWTHRSTNTSLYRNKKKNQIFNMILKEGNRNISNQKIKEVLKNENLLQNADKRQKTNNRKCMQNKSMNQNKILRKSNIFFWHQQKNSTQKQSQNKAQEQNQQYKLKQIKVSRVNLNQIDKKNTNNNENALQNKQKPYKKCSIIKRVSQNYFQNLFLTLNKQKDTSSNQQSKKRIERQKLMTCGGISKIQNSQQSCKTFHVTTSFLTSKQNFKTFQKFQKQYVKGSESQSNLSEKQNGKIRQQKLKKNSFSLNKLFAINISPQNNTQTLDNIQNNQFNQIFKSNKQNNDLSDFEVENREISRIIQQDSFSSSNESMNMDKINQTIAQRQQNEQQNKQRTSIQIYTVQKRISERKRSSSHSRISQHLQKFNTLQMQIQLARKKSNQSYINDQIDQNSNSSINSNEQNNMKEWEDFAQTYRYIRQPAQIADKFSQSNHFRQSMWDFSKFSELMCDPKNQQCQFSIKGQQLTQNFVVKTIRKICEPNYIKLFPQKFKQVKFDKRQNCIENNSINLQQNHNYPKKQQNELQYNTKLKYVVNFLCEANPKIITRLFEDKKIVNPFGVYCIWLRNMSGKLQPIFINDQFAFEVKKNSKGQLSYQPIYSWLVNDNCLWFMLLEKAVAKVLGSYSRINQVSLAKLISIIVIAPLEEIKVKSIQNLSKILQEKVYENNRNTLCALKCNQQVQLFNDSGQLQNGRIDRVVNYLQNKIQVKQSLVTLKQKQKTIKIALKQFYLKYKQMILINLNLNLHFNQIRLTHIQQSKQNYACLFRIKKHKTLTYLSFNQNISKISIYRQIADGSTIGSKQHIIYENIIYQQIHENQNESQFQMQFQASQYICIVNNQNMIKSQLFVFSDQPIQLLEIHSNIVIKAQQLIIYAKDKSKKMRKRKTSRQISQFQYLHESFPCTLQTKKVKKQIYPHSTKENKGKF